MCEAIVVSNTHRQISENSLRNGDLLTRSRARITNNQTDLHNVLYKVLNRLLQKAKQDGKDPYLSLLANRNTPFENIGSPAQLLMNRRQIDNTGNQETT